MAKLVGFLGGPCTGKTTLAHHVYQALTGLDVKTSWANEFVSEDIERIGPPDAAYSIYEQFRFSLMQRCKEERALRTSEVVVTDAPLLLGYAYPLLDKNFSIGGRQQQMIADLKMLFEQDAHRYDMLYLLKRETSYEDNGIRYHTYDQALTFDKMLADMLDDLGVRYKLLGGKPDERAKKVLLDLGYDEMPLSFAI